VRTFKRISICQLVHITQPPTNITLTPYPAHFPFPLPLSFQMVLETALTMNCPKNAERNNTTTNNNNNNNNMYSTTILSNGRVGTVRGAVQGQGDIRDPQVRAGAARSDGGSTRSGHDLNGWV
jgi:hypothetical protein